MAKLFDRKYELVIIPREGEVRTLTGLHVMFNVVKTLYGIPNKGQIGIYNPAPDTIAALRTKYTKVILNAGYGSDLRLVFKGEVKNVTQEKTSVDRLVTVYAGDGARGYETATFSKTWGNGIDMRAIVQEVAGSLIDVVVGELSGVPATRDKPNGLTLDGQSSHLLDELADEYNAQWNIQDGVLNFLPLAGTLLDTEAVLLSPNTGMIGSPTVTERGVQITSLLNNQLVPGTRIIVEAQGAKVSLGDLNFRPSNTVRTSASGLYKALAVNIQGDSRGKLWQSTIDGERI